MARVPESAFAAAALRQRLAFDQLRALHARDDELGDAVAALDRDGILSEVGEDHAELAAVVAVDGAGAVRAGDALAQRQAGARSDLAFESVPDGDRKASRNQGTLPGRERDGGIGAQVEAGGSGGRVRGERKGFSPRRGGPDDVDWHAHEP